MSSYGRDQPLNRFGQPYRGRGNRFTDFVKKVLRTGAKTGIEVGGKMVSTTLKGSSNPALQVLGHIAGNTSKGVSDALSTQEPVKTVNVKGDLEQEGKTSGGQQAEQMASRKSKKRKADTSEDLEPKIKSSRRAKGGGRKKKESALWDIWNC